MTIEVCIDSVESAINARKGGAHRVELCDNLIEGGTTPGPGMITTTLEQSGLEVMVMIRPRGGDFLYDKWEYETMRRDLIMIRDMDVHGVVFGLLLANGHIDKERTAELIDLAGNLPVTFHRAFDMAIEPYQALDDLMGLGVGRLLTSGQAASAFEGRELIAELVKRAGQDMVIMPGAGVREHNIRQLVEETGVRECHVSGRKKVASGMQYINPAIFMGVPGMPENEKQVTDPERIRGILKAVEGLV